MSVCVGAAALAALWWPSERVSYLLGLAVGGGLALTSYLSLSWALRRSDKIFYSVFVGGVLFRMSGLGVTGAVVWFYTSLSLPVVLLTVVGTLMALSFVEGYFILREGRHHP